MTSPNNQLAEPVAERADGYAIVERDDDMFITQPHWQFGSLCIARRPKLMSNDEWRPIAQRIVAALASPAAISGEGSGAVTEALREALKLAKLAEELTGCRGDDDYMWGVQDKIKTALAILGSHP